MNVYGFAFYRLNFRCSGVSPVNVNTATIFELMSVPGLTQEMAASICHIREKKGPFKSVDALRKVKGTSVNNYKNHHYQSY